MHLALSGPRTPLNYSQMHQRAHSTRCALRHQSALPLNPTLNPYSWLHSSCAASCAAAVKMLKNAQAYTKIRKNAPAPDCARAAERRGTSSPLSAAALGQALGAHTGLLSYTLLNFFKFFYRFLPLFCAKSRGFGPKPRPDPDSARNSEQDGIQDVPQNLIFATFPAAIHPCVFFEKKFKLFSGLTTGGQYSILQST